VKEDTMTDTTVLTEALDRAIGPGPDGPDLPTLLRRGQRTVRRRRAGVVATSVLAVVAAAGVALTVEGPAPTTTAPIGPASTADDSDAVGIDMTLRGHEQIWDANARRLRSMNVYSFGSDGSIDFPPGVTVLRSVDNALGLEPEESSVAYVVQEHGDKLWYLSRVRPTGPAQSIDRTVIGRPGVDAPTFEDWIAAQGAA
jgi:hypothetical protein